MSTIQNFSKATLEGFLTNHNFMQKEIGNTVQDEAVDLQHGTRADVEIGIHALKAATPRKDLHLKTPSLLLCTGQ
jgi:hypothetical protein